jgi:hypothetical protein
MTGRAWLPGEVLGSTGLEQEHAMAATDEVPGGSGADDAGTDHQNSAGQGSVAGGRRNQTCFRAI